MRWGKREQKPMEHVLDAGLPLARPAPPAAARPTIRLAEIGGPADLRRLAVTDLTLLAAEIRRFLVAVAAERGGHFAPSLGAVELTLALHYVYETPDDLLVWDVGHQAYVHKIITGRREQFGTLRQYGGLSGFLRRSESGYDAFGAGHASTAVSAALGLATGRDLLGQRQGQRVVAVVGDGAMTGGLAFEALNNAGSAGRDLLVVLNDNAMSISPNVGAVAHYLTSLTTHPYYLRMKEEIAQVLGRLPRVGQPVGEVARRVSQGLKTALVPGALFEALGFNYLGPIDGHDVGELVDVLRRIREQRHGPVLLHVLTQKGKGYAPAEADPLKWHGVGPFDPATGRERAASAAVAPTTFTQVFGEAALELARRHADVVAITAAMSEGTGLSRFQEALPDRCFDVGIAEGHAVTFAAGLAVQGLRPLCAIYSTFLQRAFDHIAHDVALQRLPVIFAIDRAGLVGPDGPTHHGCFDLAYLRIIPDMVVAAPKDADELCDLLETAHQHATGPFAVRYPREACAPPTRAPRALPVGSWEIVEAGGWEVALLAVGPQVALAREVARGLRERGVDPTVVNARFIKPLDLDVLGAAAARSRLVVTIEEAALSGGFGSAVHEASVAHDLDLSGRLMHFGIPDRFVTHGSRAELLKEVGLTPEAMLQGVWRRLERAGDVGAPQPAPRDRT